MANVSQPEGSLPVLSEVASPTSPGNTRGIENLSQGEELLSLRFYKVLLDPPTLVSQIVVPSPEIDIEMVLSPMTKERPNGGENSLDRVSILEPPIAYSPEFEIVSTKAIYEGVEVMKLCLGWKW